MASVRCKKIGAGHYTTDGGRLVIRNDEERVKGCRWFLIARGVEVFDCSSKGGCVDAAAEIVGAPGLHPAVAAAGLGYGVARGHDLQVGVAKRSGRTLTGERYVAGDLLAWQLGLGALLIGPRNAHVAAVMRDRAEQRALAELRAMIADASVRAHINSSARLARAADLHVLAGGRAVDRRTGARVEGEHRLRKAAPGGVRAHVEVWGVVRSALCAPRSFALSVELPDVVGQSIYQQALRLALCEAIDNPGAWAPHDEVTGHDRGRQVHGDAGREAGDVPGTACQGGGARGDARRADKRRARRAGDGQRANPQPPRQRDHLSDEQHGRQVGGDPRSSRRARFERYKAALAERAAGAQGSQRG